MDPRLIDLYEQELRYFRQRSGEFALAYPKIAARLAIDQTEVSDPYVERLIEASAFLSARVALKLDAEYPLFASHLLNIVYPHYLAPTPAMVVLGLEPELDDAKLAAGPHVPRGSGLRALTATGEDTQCEFRTAAPVRLWPIEITQAKYFTYAPDLPLSSLPHARDVRGGLRITLRARGGLNFDRIGLDALELHLSGDNDVAWQLYDCAIAEPVGALVFASGEGAPAPGAGIAPGYLTGSSIEPMGFEDHEALLPKTVTGFSGYRLMQEYFAFPERFGFVRIKGLAPILSKLPVKQIEVALLFSRGEATLEKLVSSANVQLHCVPAINLFAKRLDRVAVDEGVNELHLVPDRRRPMDFEVHSIEEVIGYSAAGDDSAELVRQTRFLPFYSAFHDTRGAHPAYYTTTREPRQMSQRQKAQGARSSHIGSELYMQLVDPQQAPYSQSIKQLSVSALCSNRDLPLLLSLGRENDFEFIESQPVKRVRTLRGPSRPVSPVLTGSLGWMILDHLALNHFDLTNTSAEEGAAALRQILMLYARHADGSRLAQVRGLLSVSCRPLTRRLPMGGPISFGRGLQVSLVADLNAFHGHSALLFGAVLSRFLERHVEVNHFVETLLLSSSGETLMKWRPRCGSRPIL